MEFYQLLASFDKVETVIGLLAFALASVLGYFAYRDKLRSRRIGKIISQADTSTKADLAIALEGVFPSNKIPGLTSAQGFKLLKIQLAQKARDVEVRAKQLTFVMVLICVLSAVLLIIDYRKQPTEIVNIKQETHAPNSHNIKAEHVELTYIDSSYNDSIP